MGAIFMYLTWVAQQDNNALVADFKTYNYFERILFVCFDLIIYAIKFFIPFKLAAFHPYPEPISWYYYLTPVIIAAVCFYIFKSNQRRHLLIFGALFYFINLILVLQFVSIGNALFAERYTYMPYNGLLFVAGTMLFSDSMKSKQVWAVILTIATVFSVITFQRVKTWKNSETLWTDQIEKYPDNPHGYYDRGTYYSETGQYEKAIVDLDKAVSLKQEYKHFLNRGVAYLKLKNYEKAFDNFSDAYKLDSFKNEASAGLAQYYNAKGMNEEAIYYINRSLSQKNTYEGLFTKAAILKGLRRYDDAVLTYNEAIAMNDNPSARFNLANIYFSNLNDFNKAVSAYDAVLNLDPNYPNAAAYKGFALYKANRFSEAITAFNQALQSDAKNAQVLGYLSMAYQMNGDISKARQQAATAESAGFVFDQEFMNKIK